MDPAGLSPASTQHHDVELSFVADVGLLPLARAVAAAVARQVSADPAYVNAVRLSANELVATLITAAKGGSMMRCRFRLRETELRLSVAVQSSRGQPPEPTSSQVVVLNQLVESTRTVATPSAAGDYEIRSDVVIVADADRSRVQPREPI